MEIVRVQRWVMSALSMTVGGLIALGMVLGAVHLSPDKQGAATGLSIEAAVVGVGTLVGVRFINGLSWKTPWLLLGLLPTVVGLYLIS